MATGLLDASATADDLLAGDMAIQQDDMIRLVSGLLVRRGGDLTLNERDDIRPPPPRRGAAAIPPRHAHLLGSVVAGADYQA